MKKKKSKKEENKQGKTSKKIKNSSDLVQTAGFNLFYFFLILFLGASVTQWIRALTLDPLTLAAESLSFSLVICEKATVCWWKVDGFHPTSWVFPVTVIGWLDIMNIFWTEL